MKKILVAALAAALLVLGCAAFAHDGEVTLSFEGVGASYTYDYTHVDDSPWKGLLTVNVTNTSTQAWGDFHFMIFNGPGVVFTNYVASSQSNISAVLGPGATSLDLYYYDSPVASGQSAWFQVYTDNTANQNAFFGVGMYPTPVPEPSALVALGSGILGMGGMMIRRRK